MTTVAEPIPLLAEAVVETTGTPVETEVPAGEMTETERAWVAKWLEKSPEWSAEKWNKMGHVLGVRFR